MTPQQLFGLGVRLFSIWLLLLCVRLFITVPAAFQGTHLSGSSSEYVAYLIGALYFAVGLGLWFFPMAVSHAILPRTQHSNPLKVQGYELARVGSALLGLWLFASSAMPSLVQLVIRSFIFGEASSAMSTMLAQAKLETWVALVECVFSGFLVFKSGTFATVILGLQPLGSPQPNDEAN